MVSTSVPNGGSDNVVNGTNNTDNTDSSLSVTFDRPIETSTFTPANVLQIMGPVGSISGPQSYPSDDTLQTIPAATSPTSPGVLQSTVTIPSFDGTFKVADISVQLNAVFSSDSSLTGILIAPNGSQVTLFSGLSGGQNFVNTTIEDAAETSITTGAAPFTGTFKPSGSTPLSSLNGLTVDMKNPLDPSLWVPGVWTLKLINSQSGATGILENWSLNITPAITVTPVNPVAGLATTFTIGFPQQDLSGTYTLQVGPNPVNRYVPTGPVRRCGRFQPQRGPGCAARREFDQPGDHRPVHRGRPAENDPCASRVDDSGTGDLHDHRAHLFIVQGDTTSSGISGLRVELNLSYPTDSDLTLTLEHFDSSGDLLGTVPLATSVGSGTNQTANFTNTIFDDNATTPIQNGGAPFIATFNPQMPLSALGGDERPGNLGAGGPEQLDHGGLWHHQQLVDQLPETVANLGLGRAWGG